MSSPQLDPAEALALADGTRRRIAERGQAWWYHPVLGLGFAVMTAGLALPSPVIGTVIGLMIVVVNITVWRGRSGLSQIRHGRRTLAVLIPFALMIMGGFLATFELWHRFGVEWAPLVGGPILGVVAAVGSWLLDRAWLAQQGEA